jgi:hypothetical protein
MPKPLNDRIALLKAKQDQLAVRLANLQTKAKSEDRKRETRRKIIVGGAVLNAMEKDQGFALQIRALLAQQVGRSIDREVIADLLAPSPAVPLAVLVEQDPSGEAKTSATKIIGTRQDAQLSE